MKKYIILLFAILQCTLDLQSQSTKEAKLISDYITVAFKEYENQNYEGALKNFESSLSLSSKYYIDTNSVYNAGISAHKLGKYDIAKYYYRKCISYQYGDISTYTFLAQIEKEQGNSEKYIQVLKEGIGNLPQHNYDLILELINYYLQSNQINEAIYYLDKAIERDGTNAILYFAKGAMYEKTGDFENTKYNYENAIRIKPDYFDAYYNLAVLYFNRSADLINEAGNIPVEEESRYAMAMDVGLKEIEKSLPYFEKAYLINPQDESVLGALKLIYGRLQKKKTEYEQCFTELSKLMLGQANYYTPYNPFNPSLISNEQLAAQTKQKTKTQNAEIQSNTLSQNNQATLNKPTEKAVTVEKQNDPIDMNIPVSGLSGENTFALVIGNEEYKNEIRVTYAVNDALIFKEYLTKTLGIPSKNVRCITNASLGDIYTQIKWITDIQRIFGESASIIIYYAGHGMPDENTRDAYLLPVDGISEMPLTAIKLDWLYNEVALYKSNQVIILLDACFSGAARDGMLAKGRGVKIQPKPNVLKNNLIVFSATNESQTAYPFEEKGHGLFTYFLIKKLNESKGNVTLGELTDYVTSNVAKNAIVINSKPQTPTVNMSIDFYSDWKEKKIAN
jgi:tetratricopeptide (TPR) repeat protein